MPRAFILLRSPIAYVVYDNHQPQSEQDTQAWETTLCQAQRHLSLLSIRTYTDLTNHQLPWGQLSFWPFEGPLIQKVTTQLQQLTQPDERDVLLLTICSNLGEICSAMQPSRDHEPIKQLIFAALHFCHEVEGGLDFFRTCTVKTRGRGRAEAGAGAGAGAELWLEACFEHYKSVLPVCEVKAYEEAQEQEQQVALL